MTEEKKEPSELDKAKARIAQLERENRALLGKKKMLSTSTITVPPMGQPRPSILISTTIRKPHPIGGKPPMLQTHGLPPPQSPEEATGEILARVKRHREVDPASGVFREVETPKKEETK